MEETVEREAVAKAQTALAELGRVLAPKAQELAEQTADERGVDITQVCVMASPSGEMQAIVL